MHPSGTVGDVRRAGGPGEPAGALLPARPGCARATPSRSSWRTTSTIHAVMWAARRSGLYYVADQHPPHRRRGGLHHRQQQREGHRRLGGAAEDARGPRGRAAQRSARAAHRPPTTTSTAGSATPNALPTNRIRRSTTRSRATCCSTRRAPPVGPRASSANCRTCHPAEAPGMMSALVAFWIDPDAVYLSPAPLYHTAPSVWSMSDSGGGHHHGRDGEVRRRRQLWMPSSATASRTASSSR